MAFTSEEEAEIKRLYHANVLTLDDIGARYGKSGQAIAKLAHRRDWPRRAELAGTARRSLVAISRALEQVLVRMGAAMNAKLEQMEKGMQAGELGSEEFERDSKAIAAMAAVMQKAIAAGPNAQQNAKKEPHPQPAEPGATADEIERLQREIMERFERIQRRRNAEAGSE
jgi:hypothetical protein